MGNQLHEAAKTLGESSTNVDTSLIQRLSRLTGIIETDVYSAVYSIDYAVKLTRMMLPGKQVEIILDVGSAACRIGERQSIRHPVASRAIVIALLLYLGGENG